MSANNLEIESSTKKDDLSLYLHTIAHELKTPIIAIQGFAALLTEKYAEQLPHEGQTYLQRIDSNVKRAESLLQDIAKLAKISVDDTKFQKVGVDDIVRSAIDSLTFHLREKEIELTLQDTMPVLFCDPDAMSLVFTNLIGNAIKYSRPGRKSQIAIGYSDDELFYKFFIKDNGIGFRASDRNRIFVLFKRLKNKPDVGGSGVGLSIVKKIIESHGGEVWVVSRLNHGATFYFTLPKIAD
jgi:signal transduction histidine kinase